MENFVQHYVLPIAMMISNPVGQELILQMNVPFHPSVLQSSVVRWEQMEIRVLKAALILVVKEMRSYVPKNMNTMDV